jgi:hypothetical protein
MEETIIDNKPDGDIIWRGLGGHFDSLSQIINEFIDNSISNFIGANPIIKNIVISIEEKSNREYFISIEDSGTGIRNINAAFTLGSQESKDSPLNEHGFGFKHALATANPNNNNWIICTRTAQQFNENKFTKIEAGYKFANFKAITVDTNYNSWPGQLNGSGTYMAFTCSEPMYKTLSQGFSGNFGFESRVNILIEDIGFVYCNLIKEDIANISIIFTDKEGKRKNKNVKAIEPDYEKFITPGKGTVQVNLDSNHVDLEYEFGAIKDSDFNKYYKRNMSTSGVEIRLNGRMISYGLFKEIWGIEKHNSYNYLLIKLNIKSDTAKFLPTTRTSKNGIRKGDPKLDALFAWVKSYLPTPQKSTRDIDHEIDLFEELKRIKLIHLPDPKIVTTEQKVFRDIKDSVRIDLYEKTNNGTKIYEGKKDFTCIQDLYQLKMYWDGCIIDGLQPNQAILIASSHPHTVKDLLRYINQMKDSLGNNYNFVLKEWKDEGIDYPKV